MRLHRLEMTAFGPYAGTEVVDFDALSDAGLFLLHGPTGAGKTSILDAICFALFGQVPGVRQKAARLRSDHAEADAAPSVSLELTVRGRRIEVTRSPAWQRPKRRGTGTTTEQAKTLLRERFGDRWVEVSNRNDEASKHVVELLGMSAEQFTQVVLLPQGQFAEFLRADAETRRPLLEKLFNTAFYSDVEAAVTAQRHELRTQVAVCDQQRREAVSRLVEAAGADDAVDDLLALDDHELSEWAEGVAAAVESRAASLTVVAETAAEAEVLARAALDGAQSLARAQDQWRQAAEALERLDEQAEALAAQRERLQVARKADRLRGHLEVLAQRRTALADAAAVAEPAVCPVSNDEARRALLTSLPAAIGALLGPDAGESDAVVGAAALQLARESERYREDTGAQASETVLELLELEDGQLALAVEAALDSVPQQLAFGDESLEVPLDPPVDGDDAHGPTGITGAASEEWEGACEAWLEELRAAERSRREELGRLSELQAAAEATRRAEERRDGLIGECAAARSQVEQLQQQLADLPDLADLESQLADLRITAAQQPAAEAEVELWTGRLRAATRLQQLAVRLAEVEEQLRTAIDEAQSRIDDWQRLRQARLDGFAAELAGVLVAGEPCAVCGSCDHPAPAATTAVVKEADEQAAERSAQQAAAARQAAEQACAAVREEIAAARSAAGGGDAASAGAAGADDAAPADDTALMTAAEAQAQAATARLAVAELAVADVARREVELAALTAQRESARQQLHGAELRLAERAAARDAAVRAAAEQLQTLVTVLRLEATDVLSTADLPDLAAMRTRLEEECSDLVTAAAALDSLVDAGRAATITLAAATAAAQSAGIPLGAALDGLLTPEQLDELEMEIGAHDEARAALSATVTDEQLLAAVAVAAPDLETLQAVLADAERTARQASAESVAAGSAAKRCGLLLAELVSHLSESAPVRARHALVSDLAFCLEGSGGGNAMRMRLSAFVLAARLEAVAEVASQRLAGISGGRYALLHSDESTGRGRSGLGLKVVDSWTGAERDTSTLSGGETFFVSLALALALADVVTAEAGGVLLETLFVDEGFGSLDEETLDEVMATLDSLRDGGRAVGVVSHVADMRQRIPAQLEVCKGRRGSSLVLHGV